MRYRWEIIAVLFIGAVAYSLFSTTTYARCELTTEAGEVSEQFLALKRFKYPWPVFLGYDAILTGGSSPFTSYVELSKVSGVGYIQADKDGSMVLLFGLSGEATLTAHNEVYSGKCHRIQPVFL